MWEYSEIRTNGVQMGYKWAFYVLLYAANFCLYVNSYSLGVASLEIQRKVLLEALSDCDGV